jgi:hypothetical protein
MQGYSSGPRFRLQLDRAKSSLANAPEKGESSCNTAEVAFAVIDRYQGERNGTALVRRVAEVDRAAGLDELIAAWRPWNLFMHLKNPMAPSPTAWLGKGLVRSLLLVAAAAAVAAFAAGFGIAHDYGYLRASILTGSEGGQYYALATRLADRARREHGTLKVIPTAGSIENITRLAAGRGHCSEQFAFIQDGTPVPADARLELLGRLPQPESLMLLGRQGHPFRNFSDLRGASIGIGPEGSGTAYLMRKLFEDADLRELDAHLSNHELQDQAQLVAKGELGLAAFVMQEDAEFLQDVIRQYRLDIVSPQDLPGLIARYPWLALGRIPAVDMIWCALFPLSTSKLYSLELCLSPILVRVGPTASRFSCLPQPSFRVSSVSILPSPQVLPRH